MSVHRSFKEWKIKKTYVGCIFVNIPRLGGKNAANGQQSTLLHLYEMQSKTVNRVKNSQKQFKVIKIGQKRLKMPPIPKSPNPQIP